jgi:hypothetical protein
MGEGVKSMMSTAAAAAAAMERTRTQMLAHARARRDQELTVRVTGEVGGTERKCARITSSAAAATATARQKVNVG